jgi:hypothetical protein
MDKRISLLNSLKIRLNKLVTNKNITNENEKTKNVEYARLKAAMLNDNVLSGFALSDQAFHNNEVYAESNQGKLSYHIYPTTNKMSKPTIEEPEHIKQEPRNREKPIKIQTK